ncbi:hypothetical protein KI811_04190 [Geobacter hydrogenophilus]|nr:hypothetical protein [Geobacter hydrogenophilus]
MIMAAIFTTGFAPIRQEHDDIDCKPGDVIIGKTTKRQIVELCGLAPSTRIVGNYEILEYHDMSAKVGKAIGLGALGALAGGIPLERLAGNYKKEAIVFVDITSGIVRDYYYHNYDDNKGHDLSETTLLQADDMIEDGNVDEAIALLKQAISQNKNNHRAINTLAWLLAEMNIDSKAALTYAQMAVEIFPDSPYNNGTLGIAYMRNNDRENAKKHLEKALNLFALYFPNAEKAIEHDKAWLKFASGEYTTSER